MVIIYSNNRIRSASLTGVQRYLTEITRHSKGNLVSLSPKRQAGGWRGHLWEQLILPTKIKQGLLWSPSNTGPLAVSRQIVTIHDAVTLDHPEWMSWKFAAWYRFLLPRLVYKVQKIITVSEFTKMRLLAITRVSADKIVVIPLGVNASFRPHESREIEPVIGRLSLPTRRYLLTVGSVEPRKNLRRLFRGWEKASGFVPEDIWLVVAGGKGSSLVFAKGAAVETLPPRTFLTGRVDDQDLPALYAGAEAFAYMSEYEGFGLPPLEAMASGVPVLVSNTTSLPEVVGDAGLYADPLDVDDIASGIIRLLTDKALAADLTARGVERAKSFTWERTAQRTMEVLERCAAEC